MSIVRDITKTRIPKDAEKKEHLISLLAQIIENQTASKKLSFSKRDFFWKDRRIHELLK